MLTEHFVIYMQILAVQSVFMGVSLRLSLERWFMEMEMEIAMPGQQAGDQPDQAKSHSMLSYNYYNVRSQIAF